MYMYMHHGKYANIIRSCEKKKKKKKKKKKIALLDPTGVPDNWMFG